VFGCTPSTPIATMNNGLLIPSPTISAQPTPIMPITSPCPTDIVRTPEEEIFAEYIKDHGTLIGTEYHRAVVWQKRMTSEVDYTYDYAFTEKVTLPEGTLATYTADFDNDGNDEMVLVQLVAHQEAGVASELLRFQHKIVAVMVEIKDGIAIETDRCLLGTILWTDEIDVDIFLLQMGDRLLLCAEARDWASSIIFGDSIRWSFVAVTFEEGGFVQKCDRSFGGSYWEDETLEADAEAIKQSGISVESVSYYNNSITSQNPSNIYLCNIQLVNPYRHEINFAEIDSFLSTGFPELSPITIRFDEHKYGQNDGR